MLEQKEKTCLTCQFNEKADEELGGVVWQTRFWRVEHAVGTITEGTMVVKSKSHEEWLYDLTQAEILELGPVLAKVEKAIQEVTGADRVYKAMWAEQSRHVHFVLMPVTEELRQSFGGLKASKLQAEMSSQNRQLDKEKASQLAGQIRQKIEQIGTAKEKYEEVRAPDGCLWAVSLVGESLAVLNFVDETSPDHKMFPTEVAARLAFDRVVRQIEDEGAYSLDEGKV